MQPRHAAPGIDFQSHADFYRNSAYAAFPQEHRSGGSFGVGMFKVRQDPIDLIDAAVPELVFGRMDSSVREVLVDMGDGERITERPQGALTVYPANTETRSRVGDPNEITLLTVPVARLADDMLSNGIDADARAFAPFLSRMMHAPAASNLMDRMWQVMHAPEGVDHLLLDGLAIQFLAVMAGAAALSPLGPGPVEDQRIARAVEYLEAHLGDPLTVTELAAVAALSPSQFARVFKATTGEAVWAFVQRRRIERARDLLRHTAIPIGQVAFACGFASQAHMTTLFRRHLGVTPGGMRKAA